MFFLSTDDTDGHRFKENDYPRGEYVRSIDFRQNIRGYKYNFSLNPFNPKRDYW